MTQRGFREKNSDRLDSREAKTPYLRLIPVLLIAVTGLIGLASGTAFAGSLTKTSWSVSNSQTAKTGVTYSYAFTTATSAALSTVTMTVPTGTAGTVAARNRLRHWGRNCVQLSGTTLTYTVTTSSHGGRRSPYLTSRSPGSPIHRPRARIPP